MESISSSNNNNNNNYDYDDDNNLDKSYESMRSDEKDPLHYKIDSEGEPPTDKVGDLITVVKKG